MDFQDIEYLDGQIDEAYEPNEEGIKTKILS